MNTQTDVSSGLVAVAHMMQSTDGQCLGFLPFEEEGTAPVVRLSNAEAIISAKDAEIESARRAAEYWKSEHLSGNELIKEQSAALKLAREALLNDGYPCRTYCTCMACKALAAIDALGDVK